MTVEDIIYEAVMDMQPEIFMTLYDLAEPAKRAEFLFKYYNVIVSDQALWKNRAKTLYISDDKILERMVYDTISFYNQVLKHIKRDYIAKVVLEIIAGPKEFVFLNM